MVAYFFPPLGGAGVQRTLKFAKYLPDTGWDPTVITVNARDYWMADDSLAAELGERVRVVRTASVTGLGMLKRMAPRQAGRPGTPRRSAAGLRRLRTLASWFLVPDAYVGWIPYAEAAGKRLLREAPFDLIYTTSSPDSAHLVGRALAREFHLPWVADFRDPWTRRLSYRPPTRWHAARQRKLERAVLEEASQITVTAEATRDDFQARNPQITAGKVAVVTNGYDEDDFAPWADLHPAPGQMQILHAGQLNPERPAEPFLRGLHRFFGAQPSARGRLRVRFVGAFYENDVRCAQRLGLEDAVIFEAHRSHREIVAELLRSHLLLLMEQDSDRGGLILPGKIFEYLRSRRPILGLLPRGAAWDLISRLRAGSCCRTGDEESVSRELARYFAAFERGGPAGTGLDEAVLNVFERRSLTRRLASLFESMTGG